MKNQDELKEEREALTGCLTAAIIIIGMIIIWLW